MAIIEYLLEDIGRHYGDLGVGSDTYLGRMYAGNGNRGTGHFGTGIYFLSSDSDGNTVLKSRMSHEIDMTKYKLFKVHDFHDGLYLHKALKHFNNSVNSIISDDYEAAHDNIGRGLDILSQLVPKASYLSPNSLFSMAKQKADIFNNEGISSKDRTLSTDIMIMLGYDGVDVTAVPELDNSTYGSVIYKM